MAAVSGAEYKQVSRRDVPDAVDAAPADAPRPVGNVQRPWHYGLFTMCSEMNSCLDCFFCAPCQLSRQFNMLYNLQPELHIPLCVGMVLLDSMGVPASFAIQYVLRSDIRRRYGVEGNLVSDCCISWLCTPCAIQQQFLEMTSVGSCPGMSMWGVKPFAPEDPQMV